MRMDVLDIITDGRRRRCRLIEVGRRRSAGGGYI